MTADAPHITLCMAITERDRMGAALELAAALGVREFVPAVTERTLPADVARFDAERDDYRAIADRASSTGRTAADDARLTLALHAATPLADAVRAMLADGATVIVLWEGAAEPLLADLIRTMPAPPGRRRRRVGLVVGPRTGLSEGEVAAAVAQGAQVASIGSGVVGSHVAGLGGVVVTLAGVTDS